MVSTPSRSRQATRISLPDMVGPRSTFLPAFFFAGSVVLLIFASCGCDWQPQVKKKPTTVSSRGFLSKLKSHSTSADGAVSYDDDQQQYDLSNDS